MAYIGNNRRSPWDLIAAYQYGSISIQSADLFLACGRYINSAKEG